MNALGWPHLLIILAVILLLFGAAKLPALAKSVGQSARVFRGEMKAMKDDEVKDGQTAAPAVTESTETSSARTSTAASESAAPDSRP